VVHRVTEGKEDIGRHLLGLLPAVASPGVVEIIRLKDGPGFRHLRVWGVQTETKDFSSAPIEGGEAPGLHPIEIATLAYMPGTVEDTVHSSVPTPMASSKLGGGPKAPAIGGDAALPFSFCCPGSRSGDTSIPLAWQTAS
jgi:hypothetical protein